MSKIINFKFVRLLKTILDIIFGALIVACIVLVIWILVSPFVIESVGFLGTASVPIQIGFENESQVDVTFSDTGKSEIATAFIDHAEGTLFIETGNVFLVLIANLAKLLVGIGLIYVFNLLRNVVKNVLEGEPFHQENCQFLERLGKALIVLTIFRPLVEYVAASEILQHIKPTILIQPGFKFDLEILFISLLILLLAYIWRYGLELEQENALTV
jgi:hypothetical protein